MKIKTKKNKNFIAYEKKILNTFILLSKENNWRQPSITDVVKKAKITRTAFYSHFRNINDIYKKIKDTLSEKYINYFSKGAEERTTDILKSTIELTNIIKDNEDIFKCFIHSSGYNQYILDLTKKVINITAYVPKIAEFYSKLDSSIGWWDWLNSLSVIRIHFETATSMLKGEMGVVDYDFLSYWSANLSYKIVKDTWDRLGLKIKKHDYLQEYLDLKNKKLSETN